VIPESVGEDSSRIRWAIITPSYGPDLERCRILCRSVDVCVSEEVRHILIVDRRDHSLFISLQSARRQVLVVEDLIPWWIRRLPLARRWWLNLCGKPIRNWVLQQIVKIQAAASADADAVLFLDSDVAFVRPFSLRQLERDGKVALSRVDFTSLQHSQWLRNAAAMVDVSCGNNNVNYIGNLVSWRGDVARALISHLGRVRRRHWIQEFASYWQVSEYMVYGTFVEHVVGIDASGHFSAALPLVHLSWEYDLSTEAGIENFFKSLATNHVAIMIHSKNGIEPDKYLQFLEQHWEQVDRFCSEGAASASCGVLSRPQAALETRCTRFS
jgi:hypothetical protein